MKSIIDDSVGTIVLVFVALICIFVLGIIGGSFGGISEQIANQGINAIVLIVVFVLTIPPIGLIIWLISLAKNSSSGL